MEQQYPCFINNMYSKQCHCLSSLLPFYITDQRYYSKWHNVLLHRSNSTRSSNPRHGLLHRVSSKSVALHNLPHMLLFLTLQDSQKVAQLRKTKSVPLWRRDISLQNQLYIQYIYWLFLHILTSLSYRLILRAKWKLTFTSPVSFSFKTRLKTFSLGPAHKRRQRGHSSSDSLRMYTEGNQIQHFRIEYSVLFCFTLTARY